MARRKQPRAIVIGSFSDAAKQQWAPGTRAFATAKDVVKHMGTEDSYYEDLAYELRTTTSELPAALDTMDPADTMEALVRVLQMKPGVAIKTFRTFREAEAFLDLIDQLADKQDKERDRHI